MGDAQDGGAPQIGNSSDPGWTDPDLRMMISSAALVGSCSGRRYVSDPTPDFTEQFNLLDELPPRNRPVLSIDGIFLTHAHIAHRTGLLFLAREAAGSSSVLVYAMPRMADFLRSNGP